MSEVRALRAYAEVALGRQRSPQHDSGPDMTQYLRAANVKDGELDLSDVKEMNFDPNEQQHFALLPGDVLVTEGSGSLASVGASAVWGGDVDGTVCFQNTLLRLRPRPSTSGRFLGWWCRHAFADGLFASIATGANIFHLSAERVRALPMAYLPFERQRAIADFLDTETARIAALITKKRRMMDLLDERWRNEVRLQMRLLGERHGWIALKRLVVCLDSRRIPLSAEERAERRGVYPYFGASGQIDTIDDYLFDETLVLLGEDGAQLADPEYEISTVVTGRVWVNNHAHVLRPMRADPWFLSAHLSTVDRALVISGATREKITQADMNEILVPDAPIVEQSGLSIELQRRRSQLGELAARLESQISLLQEHRKALISAAVTGDLELPGVAA